MSRNKKTPVLKQLSGPLRLGDIIRVLDEERYNEIALCVQSDGHEEYPYCCMTVTLPDRAREEFWPAKYERIGNAVEAVALLKSIY